MRIAFIAPAVWRHSVDAPDPHVAYVGWHASHVQSMKLSPSHPTGADVHSEVAPHTCRHECVCNHEGHARNPLLHSVHVRQLKLLDPYVMQLATLAAHWPLHR